MTLAHLLLHITWIYAAHGDVQLSVTAQDELTGQGARFLLTIPSDGSAGLKPSDVFLVDITYAMAASQREASDKLTFSSKEPNAMTKVKMSDNQWFYIDSASRLLQDICIAYKIAANTGFQVYSWSGDIVYTTRVVSTTNKVSEVGGNSLYNTFFTSQDMTSPSSNQNGGFQVYSWSGNIVYTTTIVSTTNKVSEVGGNSLYITFFTSQDMTSPSSNQNGDRVESQTHFADGPFIYLVTVIPILGSLMFISGLVLCYRFYCQPRYIQQQQPVELSQQHTAATTTESRPVHFQRNVLSPARNSVGGSEYLTVLPVESHSYDYIPEILAPSNMHENQVVNTHRHQFIDQMSLVVDPANTLYSGYQDDLAYEPATGLMTE